MTFEPKHSIWISDQRKFCSVAAAAVTAVSGIAASAISSSIQGNAAESAANTEANAANSAANLQFQATQQAIANLAPYNTLGQSAATQLASLTGTTAPQPGQAPATYPGMPTSGTGPLAAPLTAPFTPTTAQLAATPGYQFTLNQGLQGTQNLYAAGGLGRSGAALKGAANYSEGLASTTYQQQFQNYLAQNQQIYNMLQGQVQTGEAAGAGQATAGIQGTQGVAASTQIAGQAQAAGTIGQANALSSGITNSASSLTNAALLYGLGTGGGFGVQSNALANPTERGNIA